MTINRLLHGDDTNLFNSINEEIMDIACISDVYLYRFHEGDSQPYDDPLWCEYDQLPQYRRYKVKAFREKPNMFSDASEGGIEERVETVMTFSRKILEKAGVFYDNKKDLVAPGDFVQIFVRGVVDFFDIISAERDGYVNNTDYWTQYLCETARRTKYLPERKK